MNTNWQRIYIELGSLMASEPDEIAKTWQPSNEGLRWLGKVQAVVHATGSVSNDVEVNNAVLSLRNRVQHEHGLQDLRALMYRILAVAEYNSPTTVSGAFVPVGKPLDAFASIGKILSSAKSDLLIVDPYMDEKVLTQFATLASQGVPMRLLADEKFKKASLLPAAALWKQQHGAAWPLEVRLSPAMVLHDRLISVDQINVWLLTQSLNAFAQRSPATISKVDAETAALKVVAYRTLWAAATPTP